MALKIAKKFIPYFLGTLLVVAVLIWIAVWQNQGQTAGQQNLKVVFCDVGQGDAELVVSPTSDEILIDGGPDSSVLSCLGEELPFWDKSIKYLILTHPDADHVTGLVEVLKKYQVGEVWYTGVFHDTKIYQEFIKTLKDKNIPTKIAKTGEVIDLGASVRVQILYPLESFEDKKVKELNDTSIVSKLVYARFSVLFPGDLGVEGQRKILGNPNLSFESVFFEVPHHGSGNFLEDFFKRVKPQVAVISVGKNNRYGHPAKSVLDILNSLNGQIFRTDKDGKIRIFSDGSRWWEK